MLNFTREQHCTFQSKHPATAPELLAHIPRDDRAQPVSATTSVHVVKTSLMHVCTMFNVPMIHIVFTV